MAAIDPDQGHSATLFANMHAASRAEVEERMLINATHLRGTVLTPERARQAYPLIAMTYPGTTVDAWQRFIGESHLPVEAAHAHSRRTGQPERGMLAVEDANGYIYGVLRYSIVTTPDRRRVLAIDTVSVLDLLDRDTTLHTLLDSARSLADYQGCSALMALQPV